MLWRRICPSCFAHAQVLYIDSPTMLWYSSDPSDQAALSRYKELGDACTAVSVSDVILLTVQFSAVTAPRGGCLHSVQRALRAREV